MRNQDLLSMYLQQFEVAGRQSSKRETGLKKFITFCDEFHNGEINYVVLQSWLKLRAKTVSAPGITKIQNRIAVFSEWANLINENIGVIPKGRHERKYKRKANIVDDDQVREIMEEQRACNSRIYIPEKISPHTFASITGLLFTTGLRVGEALGLKPSFVDLEACSIYVPNGKGPKDRTIPISDTTCEILEEYIFWKDRLQPDSDRLFIYDKLYENPKPKSLYTPYYKNFVEVTTKLGYRECVPEITSRSCLNIHDLRHSFAVNSLIEIYESGVDVNDAIIQLSSILGHAKLDYTYAYIHSVPKLVAAAFREKMS